jgi:hypothetical protein
MTALGMPNAVGLIRRHDPACFPDSSLKGGEANNGLEGPL